MKAKSTSRPFTKTAQPYPELLAILIRRGLVISDVAFATHCLTHHNYYRLSAYRFPVSVTGKPDEFVPGTTFEQLWALYEFDRQLRCLVLATSEETASKSRNRSSSAAACIPRTPRAAASGCSPRSRR